MDPQLLDQGGMVVMSGLGLYLVKVVVNDMKHDLAAIRQLLERLVADIEKDRG